MTVDQAIDIAWGIDKLCGTHRPTLQEAFRLVNEQLDACHFNWLSGQEARRVLHDALSQATREKKAMAKTTLTVDVEYDDSATDPESLASAADRLMETLLSTPGIMDEYGTPRFGEFFVASGANTIIVEVSGGVLQEAYSDRPVRLVLLDWDTEGCEPSAEDGIFQAGDQRVYVVEMPVTPIDEIIETSTETALQAAGIDVLSEREGSLQETRRWVLYNFDTDALLGTKVYSEHNEAVEDAAQLNDVLVLPLVIPSIVM